MPYAMQVEDQDLKLFMTLFQLLYDPFGAKQLSITFKILLILTIT